jgi:hypothetical protein
MGWKGRCILLLFQAVGQGIQTWTEWIVRRAFTSHPTATTTRSFEFPRSDDPRNLLPFCEGGGRLDDVPSRFFLCARGGNRRVGDDLQDKDARQGKRLFRTTRGCYQYDVTTYQKYFVTLIRPRKTDARNSSRNINESFGTQESEELRT